MKMRQLGSQGPEISVVGFGAWEAGGMGWGPNPPDEQTIKAMHTAIQSGTNWIDTAEVYGGGRSEELVAAAVKDNDDVLVFTKLDPKPAGSGFDKAGVRAGAEASLKRLGREVIDLYQLHWTDPNTEVEETWTTMAELVDDGLVKHIGVSNFGIDLIERCEKIRHVDSLQPPFSMLGREGRFDLLPFCKENGTGTISYGPLGYGLLTGAITKDTEFGDDDWRGGGHGMNGYDLLFAPGKLEKNLAIVDRLKPVAERLGITLAQLALAWVFHQEGGTAAIAGSRSPEHVSENAGAGDVSLDETTLAEIDEVLESR
ncbi:MAG: aldo/keto reductase [Actinobacteria bacterium]|nr:aldo/keto reductase [Actinomycetota bacterium]